MKSQVSIEGIPEMPPIPKPVRRLVNFKCQKKLGIEKNYFFCTEESGDADLSPGAQGSQTHFGALELELQVTPANPSGC